MHGVPTICLPSCQRQPCHESWPDGSPFDPYDSVPQCILCVYSGSGMSENVRIKIMPTQEFANIMVFAQMEEHVHLTRSSSHWLLALAALSENTLFRDAEITLSLC